MRKLTVSQFFVASLVVVSVFLGGASPAFASLTAVSVVAGSQTPNPVSPGGSATFTASITNSNGSTARVVSITSGTSLPTGAAIASSDCTVIPGDGVAHTLNFVVSTTGATPVGTDTFGITATRWNNTSAPCSGAVADTLASSATSGSIVVGSPQPDLTIAKTNNLGGGNAITGTPYNWVLTVSNGGSASAVFAAGATIASDQLPSSGATYGAVTVSTSGTSGTGTLGCTISSNNLSCTTTGGTGTTIPVGATITFTIPVTPTAVGSLVNPRTANACSVDPSSVVTEGNEGNNTCANTVTVVAPATTVGDGINPSNKTVKGTDTNKALSEFTLQTNTGSDTVTGLVVTGTNAGNVATNGAKLYLDNGGTAHEWDATDTFVSAVSFSGATATFTGLTLPVTTTSSRYIVVYDIAAGPVNGQTMQAFVSSFTSTNVQAGSDTNDAILTIDSAAPTITLVDLQTASDLGSSNSDNITNAATLNHSITFSESVIGFTNADLTNAGTALGCTIGAVSGSGSSYTVPVTGCLNTGTLILRLAAGGVTDAVGNPNVQTDGITVTVDHNQPTVTINQAAGQADPTAVGGTPINFTATFNEVVTGFANNDITIGGSTAGTKTATVTLTGPYNVAISGMTSSGIVTATVNAAAAQDIAGNASAGSTSTDNSVTYNHPTHDILASAGAGGAIDPTGTVAVNEGTDQLFNMTPDPTFVLLNVFADGVGQGRLNNYTFTNVTTAHTISSTFDGGWSAPTVAGTPNAWTNGGNAFVSDDSYANTPLVVGGNGASEGYRSFGFSIPAGSTIQGIEVAAEAVGTPGGNGTNTCQLRARLSWNNGTNFTAYQTVTPGTADRTFIFGGAADTWSHAWKPSEFTNANFVLEMSLNDPDSNCITGGLPTTPLYLDQVQVKVHSTPDTTAPSGGSVAYTNGYYTAASVPVTYTLGNDNPGGAGVASSTGKIQRASATFAGGICGSFSPFTD